MIYYFWLYSPTDLSIGVLPGEQSPALAGTRFEADLGDRSSIITLLSYVKAKRGLATTSYMVIYNFVDDCWTRWDFHLLPAHRSGGRAQVPWEYIVDYMPWHQRITYRLIQNPAHRLGFDRDGQDRVLMADVVRLKF